MSSLTVGIGQASQADWAPRTRISTATINVGFYAILAVIGALVRNTFEGAGVAGIACAVRISCTSLAECARRTHAAAAIDVGFCAILAVISALVSNTLEGAGIARIACAIAIGLATQAVCARRTRAAAAINVGFCAIFDLVEAQVRDAFVGDRVTGVAGAISIGLATFANCALRASAASAIDIGFCPILDTVHTTGWEIAAVPRDTALPGGTYGSAAAAICGIGRSRSADPRARDAKARVGITRRMHLVFDQQIGIGTKI
jgi:hypothetical protein